MFAMTTFTYVVPAGTSKIHAKTQQLNKEHHNTILFNNKHVFGVNIQWAQSADIHKSALSGSVCYDHLNYDHLYVVPAGASKEYIQRHNK